MVRGARPPAPTLICGLIILLAGPALGQRVTLDVLANVGRDHTLYFEGTVTAHNLTPRSHLQVHNELDVSVEAITADGRFRVLPDAFQATSDEAWVGNRLLSSEDTTGLGSTRTTISGQAIEAADDGNPFAVSGTVSLEGADRFRIIAGLRHTWAGSWPAADCKYAVAGPFKVKPGVARRRRGGGVLGDVRRFLARSVSDIGDVVAASAGLVLGGGLNPLSVLQQVLLGEVNQRQDALGIALRYIGRAAGADPGVQMIDEVLAGAAASAQGGGGDLTQALIAGLLQRHLGGALPAGQAGQVHSFDDAIALLRDDLERRLGLRNLSVRVDGASAIVSSAPPALEGHGHLESIVTYMLVDAALAAPWVEQVAALFSDATGGSFGLRAPASAARQYAHGGMDTATLLSMCTLTDAASLTGGAVTPQAPPATVVSQAQLPPGWLASGTREITPADLQQVLPAVQLAAHPITWSGMQVLQTGQSAVTVVAMALPTAQQCAQLTQQISAQYGGSPAAAGTTRLASQPPVDLMQAGARLHLLQGDAQAVALAAGLLGATGGTPPAASLPGYAPVTPAPAEPTTQPTTAPAQPAEVTPPEPAAPPAPAAPAPAPPPDPIKLPDDSFIRQARLCTGVDERNRPETFYGRVPAGAQRVGLYLAIEDAPAGSELLLVWYRDGQVLNRRLLVLSGDRRTVNYIMSAGAGELPSGNYWVEILVDDEPIARLVFRAEGD